MLKSHNVLFVLGILPTLFITFFLGGDRTRAGAVGKPVNNSLEFWHGHFGYKLLSLVLKSNPLLVRDSVNA
jgi:hypothetical protein